MLEATNTQPFLFWMEGGGGGINISKNLVLLNEYPLVAKLIYNPLCLSVSQSTIFAVTREMWFFDLPLKNFSVKIHICAQSQYIVMYV